MVTIIRRKLKQERHCQNQVLEKKEVERKILLSSTSNHATSGKRPHKEEGII
jgi:hypothetical protein